MSLSIRTGYLEFKKKKITEILHEIMNSSKNELLFSFANKILGYIFKCGLSESWCSGKEFTYNARGTKTGVRSLGQQDLLE